VSLLPKHDTVHRADVGRRSIASRRAGTGPPLVLLHGGWSDSRARRPQLVSMADEFDVIAWDAPGCGCSNDPARPMDLGDYADVVAALMARLRVERASLCGLSFGGGLALAVYARHPQLVRSLVLAGAYAGWKSSLPPAEAQARVARMRAESDRPATEWIDDYLPSFFSGPPPPGAIDLIRDMAADIRSIGTVTMLTAFAEADLTGVLPTVAAPTLLLYGEHDVRAPRPVADALSQLCPTPSSSSSPGSGTT
jgi:pimeloyl-ACP methyl ester carboxylesterase